jgi:predicted dehydrogenase
MTIGLAIAGYGYWGQKIANTVRLLPDFTLSAIVDTDQRALASVYQDFPTVQRYSSWDVFFRNAHVDALWIAVPVRSHASLAIKALKAGLDVLVEKPLAPSSHQAEQIRDAVTSTGKILLPGHIYLHDASVQQLRRTIQGASLGNIYYMDMTRTGYGIIRPDTNVIWDLAVHDIIISLFLLNEIPYSISAWGSSFIYREQANIASLLLSFQSGKRVVIQSSWLEVAHRRQINVVGVEGMATLTDMGSHQLLQIFAGNLKALVPGQPSHARGGPVEKKQYNIPTTEGLKVEAQHFAACIQKKTKPICNVQDGLQVIRILEAAQLSLMKHGKEIQLSHIAST